MRHKTPEGSLATTPTADNAAASFAPGGFGCHEAMHMASFLTDAVDRELCEHPSITANPGWNALAIDAHKKLAKLYNAIAAKHFRNAP